ncbi:MAG: glucose-1-phosphate adenylyltransferase subunit GlgD [Agathobacter sp.]|nr:glucose-1-phosphate adenylyltransferase subunit GlgD [Agathobacter sp.]
MLNTIINNEALGVIFPNSYDGLVPELVKERLMASIPFASRYRMVDFGISSMARAGIDNISLIARENYLSLMDHLGSGREWDLARKNGGLNVIPPYAQKEIKVYNGRVEALESIKSFLVSQKEKYVVMADSNFVANIDYADIINEHKESGADVTLVYRKQEIPSLFKKPVSATNDLYYTYEIEDGRVKQIFVNSKRDGVANFSMNIYVVERELLIRLIDEAYVLGFTCFERDVLSPQIDMLNIHGYCYEGYAAHIYDMKSYFDENMRLLEEDNLKGLFGPGQIYTKIRDDNPTRYIKGAKVSNVMAADGCVIEGEVENSVLFRGVKIAKGAKVKNCVLMQDTVVGKDVSLEYVITDKDVTITDSKSLAGTDSFQVFVAKGQTV